MCEQGKETIKNLWFANCRNQAKVSFSTVQKAKKKSFFKEKWKRKIEKKSKTKKKTKFFLTALATTIKKDSTTLIGKAC